MEFIIKDLTEEFRLCSKHEDVSEGLGVNQVGIENNCFKVTVDNTHRFSFVRKKELKKGSMINVKCELIPLSGEVMTIYIYKTSMTTANIKLKYTPKQNEIKINLNYLVEEDALYYVAIGYATATVGSCYLRNAKINIDGIITNSEWIDLPLNANWSKNGGSDYPLQYRIIDNQVFIRGVIKYELTSGITTSPICTLPSDITPKNIYDSAFIQIMSDGTIANVQRKNNTLNVRKIVPTEGVQNQWLAINLSYFLT